MNNTKPLPELMQYVRNRKNQKVGMVVAVPDSNGANQYSIGWSLCNTKLDRFNPELGLKIARGRAITRPSMIVKNGECGEYSPKAQNLPDSVSDTMIEMIEMQCQEKTLRRL